MPQLPKLGSALFGWFRRLRPFDLTATIERLFRYLEMLIVTALVTVGARAIFDPMPASMINLALCLLAGVYLVSPVARRLAGSAKSLRRRAWGALLAGMLAVSSIYYANLATGLVAGTMQIDRKAAVETYRIWTEGMAMSACVQAGAPYETVRRCQERARTYYQRAAPKP